MNKSELIIYVKRDTGYDINVISDILDSITTNIGNALIDGDSVTISQFGSFKVKNMAQRRICNITTGEHQLTKPHKKIDFKPCKELKEIIW